MHVLKVFQADITELTAVTHFSSICRQNLFHDHCAKKVNVQSVLDKATI